MNAMFRRIAPPVALAALLGAAAIWMQALAVSAAVHAQAFGALGPVSKVIAAMLLGAMVLLACRHLVMLGLAAFDYCAPSAAAAAGSPAPPFVSIIVPAFNEGPNIAQVLESLLAVQYPRFEVIVVDDGSSDQTFLRALPFRRRPGVAYRVLTKSNGGKFDALNHGIAQARGEIVVCIDGDSLLHPDALRHCVAHFEDPRIGAVAGNVRVANRGTGWSALQALEYVVGYGLAKRAQSAARAVTIVPGPLGAFRKSALSQVNGYDGDTFAEDFDLTIKLLGAGWHIVYEPRAVVFTEAPERTLELLKQRYRWTRGSLQVLRKRARSFATPLRDPLRFAGVCYLALECLALPALHVAAQVLFVVGGLWLGAHPLVIYWWLQLILLECAVAAFCVAVEDERSWLVALSPVFRSFYMLVLDVARLLATVEEFRGVRMGWDKLARLGSFKPTKG
jgi:cellulose synthase/poly-beta-1,6-N-acetylglucosamine synthase-like glycosyltransferase